MAASSSGLPARGPQPAYEFAFSPRKTKSTGPISFESSVAGWMSLEVAAVRPHLNPFPLQGLEVLPSRDQMHLRAATRQCGAHVRSNRTRAEDGESHLTPSGLRRKYGRVRSRRTRTYLRRRPLAADALELAPALAGADDEQRDLAELVALLDE